MDIRNNHTFSRQSDVSGEWFYYKGTWAGSYAQTPDLYEEGLVIGPDIQSAAAATQTKDMR